MVMKLYNFVEIVTEIENATIYVENYTCEDSPMERKFIWLR